MLSVPATAAARMQGQLEATGSYRYLLSERSEILLDDEGTVAPSRRLGEHRLRLGLDMAAGSALRVVYEADALHGVLHGEAAGANPRTAALGPEKLDQPGAYSPRQLYVQYGGLLGLLRVGQMTSQWGLGIVANSGAEDGDPFGHARHGDRVFRALWAVRPLQHLGSGPISDNLVVALAGDAVDRDDNADYDRGDRAYQAIASVAWRAHRRAVGVYFVRREQTDADGDHVEATVGDLFLRYRRSFRIAKGPRGVLELSAEGALVRGSTDRATSLSSPGGLDILSAGWVVRADLEVGDSRLRVEGGYASGDDNPDDDANHRFAFDPDYRVGLVLFDEVLARRALRTVARISDPERAAHAPKGVEGLDTKGRLAGVSYLYPSLRVRPRPWLEATGGLVLAWSSGSPADPFTSFEHGGAPTDSLGNDDPGRYLGTEIDAGLRARLPLGGRASAVLGVQAGVFVPADEDDLTVTRVVARAGLEF
jgi:hypothetical protein